MTHVVKNHKRTVCTIDSSQNGIITLSVPLRTKRYKQGDKVIVTTSSQKVSAIKKHRTVSEIVAQGPIKNVSSGKIIIDTARSPIISKEAQELAISQHYPVKIESLSKRPVFLTKRPSKRTFRQAKIGSKLFTTDETGIIK